ncbi:MAG: phage portal protein [Flavobacteriaceae bacterium]|jgi:HK97 family phage portal protein|nr:phage portal protein [Flavobacteriaceae bacterium]
MGFFNNLFKRKTNTRNDIQKVFNHSSDYLTNRDATSFAAIDLICSSFANLSGYFYDRYTKQSIKEHLLYDLISNPNYDEAKFTFFYNSAIDYFNGNVFWFKYDDSDGNIISLFRLNPSVVRVNRNLQNQKIFSYNGVEYDYRKILHIPSRYGYNGLIGKSIFSECSKIFSNTSELDDFINNSFNNSVGNRLIIDITKEYPNITEEQIQQLKNKFLQNYAGIKNAGMPLVKSGKIEYSKIETDFKDNKANQLIENRQFQEKEVAKLFGVPLPLLNGTETTNIESLYTIFIENAIRPLATQFEQSINKLIPFGEPIYFEYSYNSLLKTSLQTRVDAYSKQIMNGILSPNEVRRKENLPEIEAGDTLFVPANLMPLRDDVIDSYMAGSKIKEQLVDNDHPNIGDDKV